MDSNDEIPILELANDDRGQVDAGTPQEDLPLLITADDDDVYQLSRPPKLGKAKVPAAKRTQKPVAPAPLNAEPVPQRNVWLWSVLGFVGVVAFITVAVLAIRMSGDNTGKIVADRVRNHPLVLEKLGGIDECKMNFFDSLNEGGKRTDVFDVRGPKGSGQFVTFELFYSYRSIKLRTAEGEWELLDGRENGVVQNQPAVPGRVEVPPITRELPAPPPSQPQPIAPARPLNVPQPPVGLGVPPQGMVIVQVTTPLKPGTPVFALHGTTWHPAEVLAVSANRQVVVHWPHLGHDNNRAMPYSLLAVSNETLAKLSSDPNSFTPSVELPEGGWFPPPAGYVVMPDNLKLLPGTPVKFSPVSRLTIDYTVVREEVGTVAVLRDQVPTHEEQHSRRKLMIQKSVLEQLSEPDAEQKLAARLKEVQARNPLLRTADPNATRAIDQARRAQPARDYRINIPIPETSERVTKDTPLEIGTRLSAEWGRKWNVVTVTSLRENGDVEVKWEGWNTVEPVTRASLTIDKKALAELVAKQKPDADTKAKSKPANDDTINPK